MAPVIRALRARGQRVVLVMTGQHPDLAPFMMQEIGLVADHDLGVRAAGLPPSQILGATIGALTPLLLAYRPALVLVQGDTVATLAGAMAAFYAGLPVAHVEAGLRTHDMAEPYPEEMHRRLVAPLACLHFAPTEGAAAALRAEGIQPDLIHVTGNSGMDALRDTLRRLDGNPAISEQLNQRFASLGASERPLIVATVHRRENVGERLGQVAIALAQLAEEGAAEILMPLHPSPAVRAIVCGHLEGRAGAHLIDPVDHATMVWLMRRAQLLVTDSGGLQEEAPALGLRALVVRKATERAEAIAVGAAELVEPDAKTIVTAVRRNLERSPMVPSWPFGNGRSSECIADIIGQWIGRRELAA